jgi:phage gp46-like protein
MDILLQDNGDGAELTLENGDLEGDGSFYNAVYLSLFGGDNFSNVYEDYEQNGDFEESLNLPITMNNLKTVENNANKALKWLTDSGVADSVDVYAYGDNDNKIGVEITVTEPSGNTYQFGVIWENQKQILKSK